MCAPPALTTLTDPGDNFNTTSLNCGGARFRAERGMNPRSPPRGAVSGSSEKSLARSLNAAREIEHGLQAGNVSVNTFAVSPPEMPFSGIKHSGLGHEMGSEGLLDHMNAKAVIRAAA